MTKRENHEIVIDDEECWVCGEEFIGRGERVKTMHHTIPKHMKPKRNVVIPICQACHDKVTADDLQALNNFAFKTMKTTTELQTMVGALLGLAEQAQKQLEVKKK